MNIGVLKPTYAPIAAEQDSAAITYGTGKTFARAIEIDVSYKSGDTVLYCDDNIGEVDNSVTSADVSANVDDVPQDDQVAMLSKVKSGTTGDEVYSVVAASSPYVGFGYVSVKRQPGGGVKYQGNWFYKVQFSLPDENNKTKGEKIEFQTPTLKGKALMVNIDATGVAKLKAEKLLSTLAAAFAWLQTMANITAPVEGG